MSGVLHLELWARSGSWAPAGRLYDLKAALRTNYFNGTVNLDGWRCERWEGYETGALNRYAFEFLDAAAGEPFCLFLSPHQPHHTSHDWAPQECFDRLPAELTLPANVPEDRRAGAQRAYRNYLAMTLALDDMLGELMDELDRRGLAENTILVFTSDHGTQMGAHGWHPFQKKLPYEESLLVPLLVRWPGVFEGGESHSLPQAASPAGGCSGHPTPETSRCPDGAAPPAADSTIPSRRIRNQREAACAACPTPSSRTPC